jgi:hypothetical protein
MIAQFDRRGHRDGKKIGALAVQSFPLIGVGSARGCGRLH